MDKASQSNKLRARNARQKRKLKELEALSETEDGSKKSRMQGAEEEYDTLLQSISQKEVNVPEQPILQVIEERTSEIDVPTPEEVEENTIEDGTSDAEHEPEMVLDRFSSDDSDNNDDSCTEDESSDRPSDKESNIQLDMAQDIRDWARDCIVAYAHVDVLLKKLKKYDSSLPLSSKTLMKTKAQWRYEIEKFNQEDDADDAQFVYFGLEKQLQRIVNPSLHESDVLDLQFNFDGLPLFNSSSKEFWPVLGKVYTKANNYKPFVIAVYCGAGKPKDIDRYLFKFKEELNRLSKEVVEIDGKKWKINIMCCICDTPARAFIKCVKGHTGFYACERCTIKGYSANRRTLFPVDEWYELRDNISFRNQTQKSHHRSESPLTSVDPWIDMVLDFPLDFMHLGCLGITKKLITEFWMKLSATKLNKEQILRISQRLMYLSNLIPIEFQRTTRSLGDIAKWKATEYRFFLLYCGMFVLKDVLPDDLYQHFLLFCIASRILCSEKLYKDYVDNADTYLKKFAREAKDKYGENAMVLNMHNLIHIADDVRHFDCPLTNISAFPFENLLGKIKKYLRSGNKPLAQLIRRLEEEFQFGDSRAVQREECKVLKCKKVNKQKVQIQRLQYKDSELTTTSPNNVVLLKTGETVQLSSMYSSSHTNDPNKINIIGRKLEIVGSSLDFSTDVNLNIYKINLSGSSVPIDTLASNVDCKMVLLTIVELPGEVGESFVVPMLHMN